MVEIAIIVAVVAVLSALILPALDRAKQQSQASRCKDNSRHVGAAFAVYADNNNNEYVPFKKSKPAARDALVAGGDKSVTYWPDLLKEFAGDDDVWHCPACSGQFGIGYSRLLAHDHDQRRVAKASDLANPAATVVFGDTDLVVNPENGPDEWQPSEVTSGPIQNRLQFEVPSSPDWSQPGKGSRRLWNRHLERATVVFADQHAAVMPISQLGFQKEAKVGQRLWDEH
jgi:type II secretory pathway pseudopilin PulG